MQRGSSCLYFSDIEYYILLHFTLPDLPVEPAFTDSHQRCRVDLNRSMSSWRIRSTKWLGWFSAGIEGIVRLAGYPCWAFCTFGPLQPISTGEGA